tara:strand:- start:242 stop:1120 length:879 start_codon:yes stop_codon:yes gene_type:complete
MKPSIELIRLVAVILITFTHTRNDLQSGYVFFVVEKLPLLGTAILSIVSGYLYYTVSQKKRVFIKKIKTLLIPYLIANISILLIVLVTSLLFDYNPLNRLSFDSSIIFEGVFSLNSPPINPPTYFIRDIFIIFSIISLISHKEYKSLIILVPVILFGTLLLRLDVAALFIIGLLFGHFKTSINKNLIIIITSAVLILISIFSPGYLKFPISFLIFILVIDFEFNFYNTGRFSYLLHLYHSPIMVVSYPILNLLIDNMLLKVFLQIVIAIFFVYLLFVATIKYKRLRILSGGR